MGGVKLAALVVGLVTVGVAALAGIYLLTTASASLPPPERIAAAQERLDDGCIIEGRYYPTPSRRQLARLREDVRTLTRELDAHPERKYQYPDDVEYSLSDVVAEVAAGARGNSDCASLAPPLERALARYSP